MKTIKEVTKEINDLTNSVNKQTPLKEIKRIKARVAFLRMCQHYLETAPRKEFIESHLNDINRHIELIPTHFKVWSEGRTVSGKNPYSAYCKEMGLNTFKAQAKTLKYLLKA